MITLTDYHFWLSFLIFFIAIFCSFYLPGFLFMQRIDKKITIQNIILAFCIGFVLWTMQGYILGYAHLRWLTYPLLLLVLIFSYKQLSEIKKSWIYVWHAIKHNKIITIIIFIGMIFQTLNMFGSGLVSNDGVHFLGSNGIDGVMHLSYIQALTTNFPTTEPGAYLLPLKNYHYWIDLNMAELSRVWRLPDSILFFQFMPLFISVITGTVTYLLMRLWSGSKNAGVWALFFLYLGGDAAYVFMLYMHHIFGFYTPAIDNGITQFLNMPHAAAKMIFTAGLIPFFYWIKTGKKKWGILMLLLFVSLVGFKIYYGLFVAFGLGLVIVGRIVVSLITQRKSKAFITHVLRQESFSMILLVVFAIIAAMIYLPPNSGSGGLLFYPLEWAKIFLGQSNLDMREWWLRMQVYVQAGNIRNIIIYDAFAIIVTLICIHGTRLLGFFPTKKLARILGWEHILFFIPGIILFHIFGLFTLQAAGSFNVFNFFVVSGVIMALFSAFLCYELMLKNAVWAKVLVLIIVLLTVPRAFYEVYAVTNTMLYNSKPEVTKDELHALQFISKNTPKDAIIQSHINNKLDTMTTYVSYYSERKTYLSGITMIASHNQPIEPFEKELKTAFTIQDEGMFANRIKKDNIKYLYIQKDPSQKTPFGQKSIHGIKVYENNSVIIYKIE
jgi:hypothetical protein